MASGDKKNIIVIGGGVAGTVTARALSAKLDATKYNLIVIDPRPYTILRPATARLSIADASIKDRAFVPIEKVFQKGNGAFKQGKVSAIEKNGGDASGGHVVLEDGERLSFEILVLASGSIWTGPIAFPENSDEVTSFITHCQDSLKKAKDVVLVGGGAVGIEVAGEIRDNYPDINVTIVQGDDLLLNKTYPASFRKKMQRRLTDYGVNVVLNDYVDVGNEETNGSIQTRNGKTLKADVVLSTRGPRPNTSFVASSLGADTLSETGLVKIKPTLQMLNHPDIYVAGDIIDYHEQRQYTKAVNHAAIVSANILAALSGKPLKPYKGSMEMLVVTIGKSRGGGYLDTMGGISRGDWFARMVKGKGLLLDEMRAAIGA